MYCNVKKKNNNNKPIFLLMKTEAGGAIYLLNFGFLFIYSYLVLHLVDDMV